MVACGTLRGQYNLDNSSKLLTQRIQAQGRMAEPVVSTCLKTARGSAHLVACSTAWPRGQRGSYSASGRVSVSEIAPSRDDRAFFAVQFEIPDVFCLFGFILIIKRVYTDMGRIMKIMV